MEIKNTDIKYILIETFIGGEYCCGIAAVIDSDPFLTIIDHVTDIYRDKKKCLKLLICATTSSSIRSLCAILFMILSDAVPY